MWQLLLNIFCKIFIQWKSKPAEPASNISIAILLADSIGLYSKFMVVSYLSSMRPFILICVCYSRHWNAQLAVHEVFVFQILYWLWQLQKRPQLALMRTRHTSWHAHYSTFASHWLLTDSQLTTSLETTDIYLAACWQTLCRPLKPAQKTPISDSSGHWNLHDNLLKALHTATENYVTAPWRPSARLKNLYGNLLTTPLWPSHAFLTPSCHRNTGLWLLHDSHVNITLLTSETVWNATCKLHS